MPRALSFDVIPSGDTISSIPVRFAHQGATLTGFELDSVDPETFLRQCSEVSRG
jgi:hypothetical protein